MSDEPKFLSEDLLSEHFGDSGYEIRSLEDEANSLLPEEALQAVHELFVFPFDSWEDEDDDSPFAEYLQKFSARFYPETSIKELQVKKLVTPDLPLFGRKSGLDLQNTGRFVFRNILMKAMRLQADHVWISPHASHPSSVHMVMTAGEKKIETLQPCLNELMTYLQTVPTGFMTFNLDALLDENATKLEPLNELARQQIAWFRAAVIKDFQLSLQVNAPEQKAVLALRPLPRD